MATNSKSKDESGTLDVAGAAVRLGISERHVRRLVYERRIDYIKVGNLLRFRPRDLEAYLDLHRVEAVRQR